MTKQVLGNTRAFSANVGAFVSTTAYVPANWSSLSRMAGALKGGLSTFATDISNVTCISRVSDATDCQLPVAGVEGVERTGQHRTVRSSVGYDCTIRVDKDGVDHAHNEEVNGVAGAADD